MSVEPSPRRPQTHKMLPILVLTLPWHPPSIAFQSGCGLGRAVRCSQGPPGAQAQAGRATSGEWEAGAGAGLFTPPLVSHPGGSYKKIGYYDSTKDDLSWSKTDKWIGKQVLSVFSFSASEQPRGSIVRVNEGGVAGAISLKGAREMGQGLG